MEVEKWNAERWGPLSEENMKKKLEFEGYDVTRYVYPPRTLFPDHSHSIDKKDAVLSGKFKIEANGKTFLLEAGDALSVPAGVVHNAKVLGSEPVVSLDATRRYKTGELDKLLR
jgi:quercetin dioxygenase-like cupin family protein